jgi:cyclic nucleotide-binding protein
MNGGDDPDARLATYVHERILDAAEQRVPELFADDYPAALYSARRHGIGTLALRTAALSEEQLVKILKYRLAQYLAVGYLNVRSLHEAGVQHEPRSGIAAGDVHIIVGAVETGEILCYVTIRSLVDPPADVTLRARERPLFPVEDAFGWGIFNRLTLLPDLPIARIRELGRFAKNQQLDKLDERAIRAPVEAGLATFRTLVGPLSGEVAAVVGELEEAAAKRNLDYFNVPTVLVHGGLSYAAEDSLVLPHYEAHEPRPFAFLVSDLVSSLGRCTAVEEALDLPGSQGLLALLGLKNEIRVPRSTLLPLEGLPLLTEATVPQQSGPMRARRQVLDVGERLRKMPLFGSLSVAEAAVLGTFMERIEAVPGEAIIRQGDIGDDLYVIEAGDAEVRVRDSTGHWLRLATRHPGESVGEIALVTGGERTADVVALTPMTLLKLSGEAYARFLRRMVEVERELAQTAATRAIETVQKLSSDAT